MMGKIDLDSLGFWPLSKESFSDSVFQDYSYEWGNFVKKEDTTFVSRRYGQMRVIITPNRLADSLAVRYNNQYNTHAFSYSIQFFRNDTMLFRHNLRRPYVDSVNYKSSSNYEGATSPGFKTFLEPTGLIVIDQGFYVPHSDVGGSVFYILDFKGNVIMFGGASHQAYDFSSNGRYLLTLSKLYNLEKKSIVEIPHDWVAAKFITDSLIVGFVYTNQIGKAIVYDLSLSARDSILFGGYSEGIELYAEVKKSKRSGVVIALDEKNQRILRFDKSQSRPYSIEIASITELPNRLMDSTCDEFFFSSESTEYYFYCSYEGDVIGYVKQLSN